LASCLYHLGQYHFDRADAPEGVHGGGGGEGEGEAEHRAALEDALWAEGVFASEQCFLFLSTAHLAPDVRRTSPG
jgi:hypothetical protein